jgi:hypothetical protein
MFIPGTASSKTEIPSEGLHHWPPALCDMLTVFPFFLPFVLLAFYDLFFVVCGLLTTLINLGKLLEDFPHVVA